MAEQQTESLLLQTIKERQSFVRQWYKNNVTLNAIFQSILNDLDHNTLALSLSRWAKMHVLVAIYDGGALLGTETKWNELESQLEYNILALYKDIMHRDLITNSNNFAVRYHIIQESDKQDWVFQESSIIPENITNSPERIYEFLGYTGGEHLLGKIVKRKK